MMRQAPVLAKTKSRTTLRHLQTRTGNSERSLCTRPHNPGCPLPLFPSFSSNRRISFVRIETDELLLEDDISNMGWAALTSKSGLRIPRIFTAFIRFWGMELNALDVVMEICNLPAAR